MYLKEYDEEGHLLPIKYDEIKPIPPKKVEGDTSDSAWSNPAYKEAFKDAKSDYYVAPSTPTLSKEAKSFWSCVGLFLGWTIGAVIFTLVWNLLMPLLFRGANTLDIWTGYGAWTVVWGIILMLKISR